jgi:hypothetical protein
MCEAVRFVGYLLFFASVSPATLGLPGHSLDPEKEPGDVPAIPTLCDSLESANECVLSIAA